MEYGITDLDNIIGGMQSGLHILAARPSMGKTSFALDILMNNIAKYDSKPAIYFSLEMSQECIAKRILVKQERLTFESMRHDIVLDTMGIRFKVDTCLLDLESKNVFIKDTSNSNIDSIILAIREKHIASGGLSIAIVDYLQLIAKPKEFDMVILPFLVALKSRECLSCL